MQPDSAVAVIVYTSKEISLQPRSARGFASGLTDVAPPHCPLGHPVGHVPGTVTVGVVGQCLFGPGMVIVVNWMQSGTGGHPMMCEQLDVGVPVRVCVKQEHLSCPLLTEDPALIVLQSVSNENDSKPSSAVVQLSTMYQRVVSDYQDRLTNARLPQRPMLAWKRT
jgi:hypothetical protein